MAKLIATHRRTDAQSAQFGGKSRTPLAPYEIAPSRPPLHHRRCPQKHRRLRGQHAAVAVCDRRFGLGDELAKTGIETAGGKRHDILKALRSLAAGIISGVFDLPCRAHSCRIRVCLPDFAASSAQPRSFREPACSPVDIGKCLPCFAGNVKLARLPSRIRASVSWRWA